MRPHHLVLICLGVVGLPTVLAFFSLLSAHPRGKVATESNSESSKSGVRALFSFHTPSTLFPPSAIISLTDDNSTFFLSRPADFGPSLSANGLSGQLWTGSGFGADTAGRGGAGDGAEGELGCSDVPGWDDNSQQLRKDNPSEPGLENSKPELGEKQPGSPEPSSDEDLEPQENDGTDDYLHHPLPSSPVAKPVEPRSSTQHPAPEAGQSSTHADIQSLQESAEIYGKVVLLSRGGCGFLEKVKWAQRRGATALIVGDHTRGAPLITMYARGDTSNVTIPSLFTSHTTAHLLSSLIPAESFLDDLDLEEFGVKNSNAKGSPLTTSDDDRPTFTSVANAKATSQLASRSGGRLGKAKGTNQGAKRPLKKRQGWLKSLFGRDSKYHGAAVVKDSRRPPSSGRLDWFSEKRVDESSNGRSKTSERKENHNDKSSTKAEATKHDTQKLGSHANPTDDFIIGVQDWRDPDLAVKPSSTSKSTTAIQSTSPTPLASQALYRGGAIADERLDTALRGGSITPGSGRYLKPGSNTDSQDISHDDILDEDVTESKSAHAAQAGHISRLGDDSDEEHEGLWVTLTPTTMSTSPFFDTLLVLVVSPLVTLTVVYALLLLRSRIRRQRWRAPKSVVDRLPVRTYHTMSCSSTTSSSRIATPHSSSPTSPLLRPSPQSRSVTARSRPRSATATGVVGANSALSDPVTDAAEVQQEKAVKSRKSKRHYHAKQVECVVCLDEYVDGESRVMSLPCGHEFHADCITPWLTTRRRTCPICKGDVVRSMAKASSTPSDDTTPAQPYQDNPDEADVQVQAAETTNESPSAAIPIPRDRDLERGDDMAATLVNDQAEASASRSGWRGLAASMSLSAFSGEGALRRAQEDRNR